MPDWIVNPWNLTPADSLQDGIDRAGSAVRLLWKPNAPNVTVPVVPPVFTDPREEQRAWTDGVALFDLSHHMFDLFIEGPDAVNLLAGVSANNYESFPVNSAKQFLAIAPDGHLIQDAILFRYDEDRFNLVGIGAAANWVIYHASTGGYDVQLTPDPPSDVRPGDPTLFRYQVQGPRAPELIAKVFGDALDGIRFFHMREASLEGRDFYALRHGMAGEAGLELSGPWEHAEFVKNELLNAGESLGLTRVGGLAYYTSGEFSGWLAVPVPAVYTAEELQDYRRAISVFGYEGMGSLHGSYCTPNVEDYYESPFELGYGRSVAFNHDFIGRSALEAAKDQVTRQKVTLVWNASDVERLFGKDAFFLAYSRDRVEAAGQLVGRSEYAASFPQYGTIHSLAVVENAYATPGTEVTLQWGEHPGPDADPSDVPEFESIRATVAPAPYTDYARGTYRAG